MAILQSIQINSPKNRYLHFAFFFLKNILTVKSPFKVSLNQRNHHFSVV